MGRLFLSGVLLVWGACLSAQTLITPDEFLDFAAGKTFKYHYAESGELAGIGYYDGRQRSVYRPQGGECLYGKIVKYEEKLCYIYEGFPVTQGQNNCWFASKFDDLVVMASASRSDDRPIYLGEIQRRPPSCSNTPTS